MLRPMVWAGMWVTVVLGLLIWMPPGFSGRVLNDYVATDRFSHHVWQEVLSEHVDGEGRVDFNAIRAFPRRLNQYMDQLAALSPDSHPGYFKGNNARLAYWINAYNALSLRLILDYYPIESLNDMPEGGLAGFRSRAQYALGGVPYSINALEQRIVQEFYWKSTGFFGLSDLTQSAPPLLNQAYRGDVLDTQLKERVQRFIDNPQNVKIQSYCGAVTLSPVFRQFQRPLTRYTREELQIDNGSILDFIQPYVAPEARGFLSRKCRREIIYRPFDNRLQGVP